MYPIPTWSTRCTLVSKALFSGKGPVASGFLDTPTHHDKSYYGALFLLCRHYVVTNCSESPLIQLAYLAGSVKTLHKCELIILTSLIPRPPPF